MLKYGVDGENISEQDRLDEQYRKVIGLQEGNMNTRTLSGPIVFQNKEGLNK